MGGHGMGRGGHGGGGSDVKTCELRGDKGEQGVVLSILPPNLGVRTL